MALELLVSAATEAIFGYLIDKADLGSRLQSYLGRDPDKVAFKLALTRTLNNLTREHPTWVKDLFDEPFLTGGAALLLARYLQPSAPEPTGAELAEAWAAQLNLSPTRAAKYADEATTVSTYFLERLKHHLRDQKPLWDVLLMRDVGDMAGQVSSVQLDIAALRTELAQALTQWQSTATTGGVNISDITDSNLTIIGHIAGRDLYIIHQAPHRRACPTPPAKPAVFGGRDEELEAVKTALREGKDSAITALTGGGGIGKTTLAKQVAHDLYTEKVFRSVLWAEVNQAPNPTQLLLECGKLAEEKFESKNRSTPALAHAVRDLLTDLIAKECPTCEGNRVLVVLDNVWSDGRDAYTHLRSAAPVNSTILVTSRAEAVPIALSIPHRYALDYLHPEAGADFLAKYLPTAPREGLLELADLLGGYPLAMELAASRVNLMAGDAGMDTPRALARATQNYREGIPSDHSFADLHLEVGEQKERNLTLSLSYSYNDLAPDDQRRFRQLGVLPLETDFDLMLLEQLWEEEDRGKVEDYCRTLRVAALISSTGEEGWYRQHRLLRAYARALLNKLNEITTCAIRAIQALNVVGQYYDNRGFKLRALRYVEGVLDSAYYLHDLKWQVTALNNVGTVWADLGEKRKALSFYQQALILLNILRYYDKDEEADILNNMGLAYSGLGEQQNALNTLERALKIYVVNKNLNGEGKVLHSLGIVWLALGDNTKALEFHEKSLMLRRKVQNKKGESATLNGIAVILSAMGKKQMAMDFYEQALALIEEGDNSDGRASIINNIGMIWFNLGEKRNALEYFDQALRLFRFSGDKRGEGSALNNIGMVWLYMGKYQLALEYFEEALPLMISLENRSDEANTLHNIGEVWLSQNVFQKGLDFFQRALAIRQTIGDRIGEASSLNSIGLSHHRLGDQQTAIDVLSQALTIIQGTNNPSKEASILNNSGLVWNELGEREKALIFFEEAKDIYKQIEERSGEATTYYNIGAVYAAKGELDESICYVTKCVELMEDVEHPSLERVRNALVDLQQHKAGKDE